MKAFVFPGQGAQFVGMGKDLYESSPLAKESPSLGGTGTPRHAATTRQKRF